MADDTVCVACVEGSPDLSANDDLRHVHDTLLSYSTLPRLTSRRSSEDSSGLGRSWGEAPVVNAYRDHYRRGRHTPIWPPSFCGTQTGRAT